MTTFGTTLYRPVDGGHRYATDSDERNAPCAECGGHPWGDQHQLVEEHLDIDQERPRYAVEASDDGGRTYAANGLRWPNQEDAERWAGGLALRWFGCTHIRVVRCTADGTPTEDVAHQTL